ncbi:hypothetical protein RCL1_006824 [Eukaryota sp. TZLM3-RCL]
MYSKGKSGPSSNHTIFTHDTTNKLLSIRSNRTLSDFILRYADQEFSCHKSLAVICSPMIKSLVDRQVSDVDIPSRVLTDKSSIEAVIETMYGKNLQITKENAFEVSQIAQFLEMDDVLSAATQAIKTASSRTFHRPVEELLGQVHNDSFVDFSIKFRNVNLKVHRFLLAALFPKLSPTWTISNPSTDCFDASKLTVSEETFKELFDSLYTCNVMLTIDKLFDFCHLAAYFQVSPLLRFCHEFMHSQQVRSNNEWVFAAITAADVAEDFGFITEVSKVLSRIPKLSECNLIEVAPRDGKTPTPPHPTRKQL